jgi:hypothetical protein
VFKPTAANLAVILARLSVGAGMEALAPDWFAIRPSLLPSRTFHEAPPDCKYIYHHDYTYIFFYVSNNGLD